MSIYFGTYKDTTKIRFLLYGNYYSPTNKHLVIGFSNRIEFWIINPDNTTKKQFSYKVVGFITAITSVKLRSTDEVLSLAVLTSNRILHIYSVCDDYSCTEDALKTRIKAQLDSDAGIENQRGVRMFAIGDMDQLVIHGYPSTIDHCTWTYKSSNDVKFNPTKHRKYGKICDIGKLGGEQFKNHFIIIYEHSVTNLRGVIVKKENDDLIDNEYESFDIYPDYQTVVPYNGEGGGCVVLGKYTLTTFISNKACSTDFDKKFGKMIHACQFTNSNNFLMFTSKGYVCLLELIFKNDGELEAFYFDIITEINIPCCLVRLDEHKFFISGELCDHSLIEFVPGKEKGSVDVKILHRMLNNSPILDALAIEDRCDRRLIVSTGHLKDGKLIIIKDGMNLKNITSFNCPTEPIIFPLKGIYNKSKSLYYLIHNDEGYYLFVSPDNILLKKQDEIDDLPKFTNISKTYFMRTINNKFFIQLTDEFFVILSSQGEVYRGTKSSSGHATLGGYIAIAEDDKVTWYYFNQNTGEVNVICCQKFPDKVQAVKFIDPENLNCTYCIVSLHSGGRFFLVDLPKDDQKYLRIVHPFTLPGEIFTDALLCRFSSDAVYLLVSTDLGKLEYFLFDEKSGKLRPKKTIHIGVRPLKYCPVYVKGQLHVLICSDQVSVMRYESNGLTFCHLDVRGLNSVYNIEQYDNMLLYHRENELCIGIIPGKQTKSFVPITIGETIEKLVYNENTNLIITATSNQAIIDVSDKSGNFTRKPSVITAFEMAQTQAAKPDSETNSILSAKYLIETYSLVALDGDRYVPIGVINMPLHEQILCISPGESLGKNYILVGTGIIKTPSDLYSSGRLLLYEINRPSLDSNIVFHLIAEKEFDGGVLSIKVAKNKIIRLLVDAATKEVILDDTLELKSSTAIGNYIAAVSTNWNSTGDLLIFSDVMNPTSLVKYYEDAPQERLCTSAEIKTIISLDFMNRHEMVAFDSKRRLHLLTDLEELVENLDATENLGVKLYHIGSCDIGFVANCIKKGRPFVPIFNKSMSISNNSRYFTTNCGAIGVLSLIEPTVFKLLKNAEDILKKYFNDDKCKSGSPFLDGDYLRRIFELKNVEKIFKNLEIPEGIETDDLPNHLIVFKYARELWRLHL